MQTRIQICCPTYLSQEMVERCCCMLMSCFKSLGLQRSRGPQRELTVFNRQGTQQQRPESSTVTPLGMRLNTGCINYFLTEHSNKTDFMEFLCGKCHPCCFFRFFNGLKELILANYGKVTWIILI